MHCSANLLILGCKICANEVEMDGRNFLRTSLIMVILGWLCYGILSCDWTPERDNPLDPAADNYQPPTKGSIAGVVRNLFGSSPISGVTVTLPPDERSWITGGDGAYSFDGVPAGSHWVEVRKENYGADSALVDVVTSEVAVCNFRMNELPVFDSLNIASHLIDNEPSQDSLFISMFADIIDRDGNLLSIVVLFDGDTLATYPSQGTGIFSANYGSSYFSLPITALEGLPFVVMAEDTSGGVSASDQQYIFRYLGAAILSSPIGFAQVIPTPTLSWNLVNVGDGFPYHQNVTIYDNGGAVRWDSLSIPSGVTEVTVTDSLQLTNPPGPSSYHWTTEIVDQHGNTSLSLPAYFTVP